LIIIATGTFLYEYSTKRIFLLFISQLTPGESNNQTSSGSHNKESSTKKINIDDLIEDKTNKPTYQRIKKTLPPRDLRVLNTRNSVVSAMKQPLIPVITGDESAEQFLAGF